MENMRWILLLIGILLIIGIYVAGRLQSRDPKPRKRPLKRASIRRKAAPDFAVDELESMEPMRFDEDHSTLTGNDSGSDRSAAPRPPETVFSLLVTAPTSVPFRGPVLLGALAEAKLEFGDMQIFHRTEMVDGRERVVRPGRERPHSDLGQLVDETIHHMREEVIHCQLQQRVAQTAS